MDLFFYSLFYFILVGRGHEGQILFEELPLWREGTVLVERLLFVF